MTMPELFPGPWAECTIPTTLRAKAVEWGLPAQSSRKPPVSHIVANVKRISRWLLVHDRYHISHCMQPITWTPCSHASTDEQILLSIFARNVRSPSPGSTCCCLARGCTPRYTPSRTSMERHAFVCPHHRFSSCSHPSAFPV